MAYAPGMWTYRKDGRPMKSKAYKRLLETNSADRLQLPIWELRDETAGKSGHKFIEEGVVSNSDRPWGTPLYGFPDNIKIVRPTKINLMNSSGPQRGNRVFLSKSLPGAVNDNDDVNEVEVDNSADDVSEQQNSPINMPECTAIQWRAVKERSLENVEPFAGGRNESFHFEPLVQHLFSSVEFDRNCEASEYIFGHYRKYTGGSGVEEYYVDNSANQPLNALGSSFKTQGLRFRLSEIIVEDVVKNFTEEIDKPEHSGSRVDFLTHLLMEGFGASRFQVEHVIRLVIHKYGLENLPQIDDWMEAISSIELTDINEYSNQWIGAIPNNPDPRLRNIAQGIEAGLHLEFTKSESVRNQLSIWILRTMSNSLGIHLTQSGRAMTGCRDQDLGYHVDMP